MDIFLYIYIVSAIIGIFYAFMLIAFAIAWFRRKENSVNAHSDIFISVIIAFRNEEENLLSLLQSLSKQDYKYDFEIILVNDHSDDDSCAIINEFADKRIKLSELPEGIYGKKQALRVAAKKAIGDLLVFTDADCVMSEKWLSSMSVGVQKKAVDMLCGPVEFIARNTVFSKLVELEFLSLTGSGAAGLFLKKSFMCNAANYAIKKNIFVEASQYFNDKYSSGDDVFLLHYVSKKYKVDFIKNVEAIVKTRAPQNIIAFFNQRIRWASKISGYRTSSSLFSALINFLFSFLILVSFGLIGLDGRFFSLAIILLFIKTLSDVIFLIPVLSFHKKISLLVFVPLLQIFYPIYIFATGLLSIISTPKWKGRPINK